MDIRIKKKLEVLRKFQEENKNCHIGGSIGLMIHGISLGRDIFNSDLDITCPEDIKVNLKEYEDVSDGNDFDYAIRSISDSDGYYTKIDVRVCPEPSFEEIEYLGFKYKVSKIIDILFWKQKYANKGVVKHTNDLIFINTGIRPIELGSLELPF